MGAEDMRRQALNVVRMQLLGATVRQVDAGSKTLKDAINEAMRDWVANVGDTYYLLGSALGPASVSVDGARVPVGDRPRGAPADARAGRPASRHRRGVRGRRQQRDRDLRRLHRRPGRAPDWRRGRWRADRARTSRRALRRRQHRRAAGHAHVRPAGRGGEHRADAFDLGRPRLRGRRVRSTRGCAISDAPSTATSPTPRRSTGSRRWRGSKGSFRRSSRAHAVAYTMRLAQERWPTTQ